VRGETDNKVDRWRDLSREVLSGEGLLGTWSSKDILTRMTIVGYQYGDVQKNIVFAKEYGEDLFKDKARRAELKIGLADLLVQIIIFCELLNLDFMDVIDLGFQRIERGLKVARESGKRGADAWRSI
jgi:hypothetical protein